MGKLDELRECDVGSDREKCSEVKRYSEDSGIGKVTRGHETYEPRLKYEKNEGLRHCVKLTTLRLCRNERIT